MNQLVRSTTITFFYKLLLSIIIFSIIPSNVLAHNQKDLIMITDIHPGMKGIGKTVFSGIRIEEFEVEVIDIIHGSGITYPYILVKLSGDRIDNNGGISAGMSGSPVYFEGKLAGAISHSWEMSQHNLCLVTPIHIILTLFEYIDQEKQSIDYNSLIESKVITCSVDDNLKKGLQNLTSSYKLNNSHVFGNKPSIDFYNIKSPLIISCFSRRASAYIKNSFNEYGVAVTSVQNLAEYQDMEKELDISNGIQKIEPGSAIGVQLSLGDVSVMGIGTATYCQDNYVLAFGHPFLHQGAVSYLFSAVYIYHSFPNIVMPFKIGSPYLLLGEVIQDRSAGVLAKINKFPNIVPCKIMVHDLDRNIKEQSGAKVVPQKEIVQGIAPALLIQSIDNVLDRIGQGTAITKFGFRCKNNEEILNYDNIYFNENDIAVEVSNDLSALLDLLYYNFYEEIDLNEISIDVTIKEQNQSALIKEVKLNTKEYYLGENIEPQIIIAPYRLSEEQKQVSIRIPDSASVGDAVLIVRGGLSKEQITEKTITQGEQDYLLDGWAGIKAYLEEKEKNNQIIVELILFNESEKLGQIDRDETRHDQKDLRATLDTDFVVEGYHEIFLNIKSRDKPETE